MHYKTRPQSNYLQWNHGLKIIRKLSIIIWGTFFFFFLVGTSNWSHQKDYCSAWSSMNNFDSIQGDSETCKNVGGPGTSEAGAFEPRNSHHPYRYFPLLLLCRCTRHSDTEFVNLVTYLKPSVWFLCSVVKKKELACVITPLDSVNHVVLFLLP